MLELDSITLKRALKGDHRAFKLLYDHYAPFIWKVLYPMSSRDMAIARELTHDTFVKAFTSSGSFRGESAYSTWLYRVAYTTAMEHFKKQRSTSVFLEPDLFAGTMQADEFDNRQIAEKILASLPDEDRFLLVSREVDAISFDDLAVVTGKNSGALRTRLHRIKENIRSTFVPHEPVTAGVCHEYQ